MHELSLTQSIVELAVEHARREQARTILSLTVEIGDLSGVLVDAVEFAFDVCSKGTLAEGARLEIRRIPGLGDCTDCGREVALDTVTHLCPHCGALGVTIRQGEEMRFTEMEID